MDLIIIGAAVLPFAVWALVLRKGLKTAQQTLLDAQRERSTLEENARGERSRLQGEVRTRLDELDLELARERAALVAQAELIRSHYEGAFASELLKLEPLRRFEGLANAEAEGQRALNEALELATQLKERADAYSTSSKLRVETELREAGERMRRLKAEADTVMSKATREAGLIVSEAHKKAESIAGAAYVALRDKESLEQAVRAIRNVIDGYGDRYVVPTRSLLDELASDFGHLEAGNELKAARAHSARLVEEGHAAECDYAEAKRKETAVRFVIDAFNGRVDGILSRTRNDNFGTLAQEIRDAFALVNINGEAFRNARVLETYLDARLAELKWAVAAQELRLREREEQRRIQEQIREEEKARREAERAMKEAEKEEGLLQKALEKARAEVESASADERARFQQRVDELNQKLAEAEAKNQRAKSMAQQTRAGNVYVISNVGSFGEDVLKIGMTRRLDPMDRIYELGDASVPFDFDVHAMITTDDAPTLERELHSAFDSKRVNRVNLRKEFFRVGVHELRDFVASRGLTASFTMAAEAREYRETLAAAAITSPGAN